MKFNKIFKGNDHSIDKPFREFSPAPPPTNKHKHVIFDRSLRFEVLMSLYILLYVISFIMLFTI